MKPFEGTEVSLQISFETQDSGEYGNRLDEALRCAGLNVSTERAGVLIVNPSRPGVSFVVSDAHHQAANALGVAMRNAGLTDGPVPAFLVPASPKGSNFTIIVKPNR